MGAGKTTKVGIFLLIIFASGLYLTFILWVSDVDMSNYVNGWYNKINCDELCTKNKPDQIIVDKFNAIYDYKLWGDIGGGSGVGSTVEFTKVCRNILYSVIREFNITSMLDAPSGSFLWMPLLLKNVSSQFRARNETFYYHGIDVVESLVEKARLEYANRSAEWQFSMLDFTQQPLPAGYDLIFSRDALQHLSFEKVLDSLKAFSQANGTRYLLVGSYVTEGYNRNIPIGRDFPIDLTKIPFNLTQTVRVYSEKNAVDFEKHLVLYDVPNYLSKIDFDQMKRDILSWK